MRSRKIDHPIHATPLQGGARSSRRGSTIIVAVGVLAVLALVAVSYAIAVRGDRASVASYQLSADLDSSARVVRDEIGALLAADLFGNKIVTADVPYEASLGGGSIRIWPRMFEDGEFFDVPRTAPGTFDSRNPVNQRNFPNSTAQFAIFPSFPGSIAPFFPGAPDRDDAWLANTEPYSRSAPSPRDGPNSFNWTTWGQFTNLLSAYRWTRDGLSDPVGAWVRDDGRFADLAMFFLTDFAQDPARNPLRGDPGADLAFRDETAPTSIDEFTGQNNGPLVGLRETTSSGTSPINFATDVLPLQIHELGEIFVGDPNLPIRNAFDERFFADTDGDLRADARWQVLDGLDGLLGLRWVVAARIVDNSALVNVNTAMEFQGSDPATQSLVGDARTPADVDLTRLVRSAYLAPDLRTRVPWDPIVPDLSTELEIIEPTNTNSMYSRPRTNYATAALDQINPINEHLITQLGLDGLTETLEDARLAPVELVWSSSSVSANDAVQASDIILGTTGTDPAPLFTTRLHRYLANRSFGVSPLQASIDQVRPYPITDEVDLRMFFGVNNAGIISKVEQRFDHMRLDDAFFPFAGPLRATEGSNPNFPPRNETINPSNVFEARPSLFAIASDTRRHLTTVSGVADFSPVPVLNNLTEGTGVSSLVFDQPFVPKVRFRDVPRISPQTSEAFPPATADKFQSEMRDKRQIIQDSFGAFAWALAPLAGHTPLMSPLDVSHTGWSLATANANDLAKFFYGGDANATRGPAFALGALMQASGLSAADSNPGAAYAILRAASLAVNLADATDDDRLTTQNNGTSPTAPEARTAPTGETSELPTVARLFGIPYPTPDNVSGIPWPGVADFNDPPIPGDQVVRMGVSFPWGDVGQPDLPGRRVPNTVLMPRGHVGAPEHGVTLVGLDRQPFLVEVSTLAVYADSLALIDFPSSSDLSAADQAIDPNDLRERIGSIVTWEVRNAWAVPIDISDYRLALMRDDSTYLTFNWGFADPVIGTNERVVYYAVHWDDGNLESVDLMDQYESVWRAEMETRIDANNLRRIADEDQLGLLDSTVNPPMLDLADDPIPFQDWGTGSAVGVIILDNGVIPGAGTLVVDRISGNASAQIPTVQTGAYGLTPATQAGQRRTGILTVVGSTGRPTSSGSQGTPAWVVERPIANVGSSIDGSSGDRILDEWLVSGGGPVGVGPDPGEVPSSQAQRALTEIPTLGEVNKGTFPIALPSFQLFVPNTELRYTSELLQLSAFTHMYVHDDVNRDGAVIGAQIADSSRYGPGTWRTVSEQLGSDVEIYRDVTTSGAGTIVNSYLGVLDPTRFVLASNNAPGLGQVGVLGPVPIGPNNTGVPEALAIPLALRVVDCFEALWTPDWRGGNRLVQGRVNINTAAQKTLRMLPMVDPSAPIGPLNPQSQNIADDWRVPLIMAYRDRLPTTSGPIPGTPREITGLLGTTASPFRFVDQNVERGTSVNGVDYSRGFVTPGELALLGGWDAGNPSNPTNTLYNGRSFLELGANAANDSTNDTTVPSIDVRRATYAANDLLFRPTPLTGGALPAYEGQDDPEERLALYRAVSNIVTSRSDVYTAYFKVRGYAPSDIEAVQIDANPTDILIEQYLEELQPRFEARYLAVYDRSNVRTPVDRPRVLMFVRLPD